MKTEIKVLEPFLCGGLQPKKTKRYRKFRTGFFCFFFFVFFGFFGFSGFSILANFDWFNGFLFINSSLNGPNL